MTNLAKKQDNPITTLRQILESTGMKLEIKKALPEGWTPDKFVRTCITAAQKNPRIAECTAISVAGAVMECAQLGLEPDPTLGHAYLVPFKNVCTMIPGYRGFISLAMRTGVVVAIWAQVVREGEPFQVLGGTLHQIHHEQKFPQSPNPKDWVGAYACVRYTNGQTDFEYLEREKILAIKKRSPSVQSGRNSPWVTDEESMYCKTVIRKLAKRLDLSPVDRRLQRAAILDELREQGLAEKTGLGIEDYNIRSTPLAAVEGPRRISDSVGLPKGEEVTVPNGRDEREPAGDTPPWEGADEIPTDEVMDSEYEEVADASKPAEKPKAEAKKVEPKGKPSKISEAQRIEMFRIASRIESNSDMAVAMVKKIIGKYRF